MGWGETANKRMNQIRQGQGDSLWLRVQQAIQSPANNFLNPQSDADRQYQNNLYEDSMKAAEASGTRIQDARKLLKDPARSPQEIEQLNQVISNPAPLPIQWQKEHDPEEYKRRTYHKNPPIWLHVK